MSSAAEKRRKRKMASDALKAAGVPINKGGRPRKPPTGNASSGRVADIKATAVAARVRQQGVSEKQAEGAMAGSVLGLMRLRERITESEFEAGERFGLDMERYYSLTGIPHPSAKAQDIGRVRGVGGDPSPAAVRAASDKRMVLEGVLGRADSNGRPVTTVVKRVCVMDDDSGVWEPHMIGFLRRGLKALAKHYGVAAGDTKTLHPFLGVES